MIEFKEKLMKNALMTEKLYKLSKEEKHELIHELLKNTTGRALAKDLGVPYSTVYDWASLRQDNTKEKLTLKD